MEEDHEVTLNQTALMEPSPTSALPNWLTLREAAFVTGMSEDTLQGLADTGQIVSDRSLSRRLGAHYLLLLSRDLEAAGLISLEPKPAPASRPAPEAPAPAAPRVPSFVAAPDLPPPTEVIQLAQPPSPERSRATIAPALPSPRPRPEETVDTAPRPGRRRVALAWSLFGLIVGLLLATLVPGVLDYRSYAIGSGAMAPAFQSGTYVISHAVDPLTVQPGDVVSFAEPGAPADHLTERVLRVVPSSDSVSFETAGDASRTMHQWSVSVDGTVQLVVLHTRGIGAALWKWASLTSRVLLIALPVLLLVLMVVRGVHRRRRTSMQAERYF